MYLSVFQMVSSENCVFFSSLSTQEPTITSFDFHFLCHLCVSPRFVIIIYVLRPYLCSTHVPGKLVFKTLAILED